MGFWESQAEILMFGSYGVDIDAVAGWLGSYGGEDSTSDISRGESAMPLIECYPWTRGLVDFFVEC